jgi:3,4-dihydroxy 2-butanone 4-phosphate synthase/GTP cyclohydrolase II
MNSLSELILDLQAGKMVILTDDGAREDEGDLILPAQLATAEKINFMSLHARGLLCLALSAKQVDQLKLPLMVSEEENQTANKTAFTVSIEAAQGVTRPCPMIYVSPVIFSLYELILREF